MTKKSRLSKKRLLKQQKFPTGLKWVIAYFIFNIIMMSILFFFGDIIGIPESTHNPILIIQAVGYIVILIMILKFYEIGRIATIGYLLLLMAVQWILSHKFSLGGIVISFIIIYYLTKPEVKNLFKNKVSL